MAVKKQTKVSSLSTAPAVKDVHAHFRALLHNTLLSFILVDRNYDVVAFNTQAGKIFKEITGLKLSEDDNLHKLISKKEFAALATDFQNTLKGNTISSEHDFVDKKKKLRTFGFNFTPVLDTDGKPECISFSMLEMTEIRKATIDLDRSEKLIESVFHTADVGIAIVDKNARIVKMNDGLCHLLGYERNELNGKPWDSVAIPADRALAKTIHKDVLNGKMIEGERKILCRNGNIIDVYGTNKLLKNADGSVYIVKTIRDITESKKNKELLIRTETLAKLGGFEITPRQKRVAWTEEMYNIFEVEKDFTPTISWIYSIYLPQDRSEVKKRILDALTNGTKFDVVRRIITNHNNPKWVRIMGTPVRNRPHGYKLIGTIQDITAQKKAEEEIERLSWVASHTNSAVSITDSFGKIVWVNKSFEKLTGYKLDEVRGKNPGAFLQGKGTDKETVKRISQQLAKHEASNGEVILNYTKSGDPVWISADITPIFKDGKLINFIGIMTDLTAIMKAQEIGQEKEALLQKQQLFNAIATYFPGGIIGVIDSDLHYVFVGGTELKKLGMDQHQLIGDKIFNKIYPKADDHAAPYLRRALSGENVSFEQEISGSTYQVIAVPIHDHEPEITQALVVVNNISEQKKTEEGLKKVIEKQKELNEMKTKFVSIASHEFRTPLSTILSSSSLVEKYNRPGDEPKREKHLNRIKTSVHNLTEILNDFLILGKMEDGGMKNNPSLFDIRLFFKELIDEMHPNLKVGQHIKLTEYYDKELTFVDSKHFKNVLLNLLSNAIKYSTEGQTISVNVIFKNGGLEVKVRDEGIGIPAEDQVHLFNTFYRANNVTNIQGTGMGLHIVRKYMDLMGGSVGFESELNKGTTFTIDIPYASAELAEARSN